MGSNNDDMPTHTHITMVARRLRSELGNRAFLTIARTDITEMLRRVSGEPTTRLKSRLATDLTQALEHAGVRIYPALADTTTGDTVRLFHSGSIVAQLVDIVVDPDPTTDNELGSIVLKIKGKWRWSEIGQTTYSAGDVEGR